MGQFLLVFFYFFLSVVVIQIIYYLFIFGKFSFAKFDEKQHSNIPISVIVCAKNEAENVAKYVPLLLSQNYPNFELVLIDDASSDETLDVFEEFEKKHDNIKLVKVKNNEAFWGNKKFALTLGIKSATYDNLLFIDADCYPDSENWIAEMSTGFSEEKSIVLGYGAYEKIENSFLNKLIRFETLLTATQYFSWAKLGKAYMGVGRNLAYKREEFFNANGFIEHMKIRSGDDDLLVNQISNSRNTAINFNPESITFSKSKTRFKDWILQKRRHISTAKYYKSFDKFQLGLFFLTQFLFLTLPIVLLSFEYEWIIMIALIATRYICAIISLQYAAAKLYEKDLMYYYPILEIILIFTQLTLFFRNIVSKPLHWK